jgi:ribose transport system ATP-binding protein
MLMNASVIIMDEPTTSLTEPEIKRVFVLMRQLQKQHVGIIFISHKLGEVLEICTKYTVLRDGHVVASDAVEEVTTSQLAFYMVGHQLENRMTQKNGKRGSEMLRVENYTDHKHFNNISFSAYSSEVLGITGLLGDGRSELFLSIFRAGTPAEGKIFLEGRETEIRSTSDAVRRGIAYMPRNRKENAIIKDMSILENGSLVTLKKYVHHLLIDRSEEAGDFGKQAAELHIKMGRKEDPITSLSGGNQQKVVLAKWLNTDPKVLVLDNPTQGVDVGSKEEIYDIIRKLASGNVAVIVLSSEAQEIIRVCDRALVMFHGSVMGEISGSDMNEHTIMRMATGEHLEGVSA